MNNVMQFHSSCSVSGDAIKDAQVYEQFSVKPEVAWGVALDDAVCQHVLAGINGVFSRAAALRSELSAKRESLIELANSCFVEVDETSTHARRIAAGMDFMLDCMGVVESEDLCKEIMQRALDRELDLPGRSFQPTV